MAQLLVAFILLFYVPTLLFRFAATASVNLGPRKLANQIEDFFAAALPSVVLNIAACFVLNTVTLWTFAEFTWSVPLLLTSQATQVLQQHALMITGYYMILLGLAFCFGEIYGVVDLQTTLFNGEVVRNRGPWWRTGLFIHDFWDFFLREESVPQFPWIVRPTYVFIRTTDRLYHGRVGSYDRGSDGQIAGITLMQVRRFSERTREECLDAKTQYVRKLFGSFYLKWPTIVDINVADIGKPKTMIRIQRAFRRDLNKRWAKRWTAN